MKINKQVVGDVLAIVCALASVVLALAYFIYKLFTLGMLPTVLVIALVTYVVVWSFNRVFEMMKDSDSI